MNVKELRADRHEVREQSTGDASEERADEERRYLVAGPSMPMTSGGERPRGPQKCQTLQDRTMRCTVRTVTTANK